jgi:hypothetical protein
MYKQKLYEIWREPLPNEQLKGKRKNLHKRNKIIERKKPSIDTIEILFVEGKLKWDHRKGNGKL